LLSTLAYHIGYTQTKITDTTKTVNNLNYSPQSFINFSLQKKSLFSTKHHVDFGKYSLIENISPFSYHKLPYQGSYQNSFLMQPTIYSSPVEITSLAEGLSYGAFAFLYDKLLWKRKK
jgi:hypothetical protein